MQTPKYIIRQEYLDFLIRSMNKPIIKVVSGVRRSGKSTLFLLFRNYLLNNSVSPKQIININFEDYANDNLRNAKKLHDTIVKRLIPNKKNYVFLDEIQHVKDFERVVDSLYIRKNIDLYLTGSNAYFLSGELATLLSGRYMELKILPLSFKEFVAWHKDASHYIDVASFGHARTTYGAPLTSLVNKQNKINLSNKELFEKYTKSSFPFTLFTDTDAERLDYLQGIFSTVVLNDIVQRAGIQDVRNLERLLETLFSSIGTLVTVNKLKDTMVSKQIQITNATIDKYLKAILDSMIMYEAKRYDIHGRQLLDTQEKYYVVDTGLRNLLLRDHLEDFGHMLENIVFLELLRRGNKVYIGRNQKYEVDFVAINAKQEVSYYQVALSTLDENVLSRELRSLQTINDNFPKTLITMDEINREANYEGIQKVNLLDWLLT